MTQKVLKVGTSAGLSIPKEAMRDLKLRIGEHMTSHWDARTGTLSFRRAGKPVVDKETVEWTERFVERYKPALKALAKR